MHLRTASIMWVTSALLALALAAGCSSNKNTMRNSRIPDTAANRQIVKAVEVYRRAVENRDSNQLVLLASPRYHEDGGTPGADDDYGQAGLTRVLQSRFKLAKSIRYRIEYRRIVQKGRRATVDIYIDGSFLFATSRGDVWHPVTNYNRLELEYDNGRKRWLFIAGM